MNFDDIKQMTRPSNYQINVDWDTLRSVLDRWKNKSNFKNSLEMNPSFQRGHVWTEQQQIDYVEFKLRGGTGSNDIYFNCVGWMDDFRGPFVLVDGKHRINAVISFLENKIKVFDTYFRDYEGQLQFACDFIFYVNNLKTMNEVYQWYIEMNTGGTPHTKEEIDKVKSLMNASTK